MDALTVRGRPLPKEYNPKRILLETSPPGPDVADPVPDSWAGAFGSDSVSVGT